MNNMYLIPANSKKGQLIFNLFRWVDLIVFLTGTGLTLILFVAISSNSMLATTIKLLPICLCAFLVFPIPHYHNVMMFIKDMYLFISNRRVYLWKGWCVRDEYKEK